MILERERLFLLILCVRSALAVLWAGQSKR